MFNPLLFNYVIMTLYVINSLQFALRGAWPDAFYWASAFAITATVTWGYGH